MALRLEALYRSGLLADMETVLSQNGAPGPIVQTLRARRDIGLGRRDVGCQAIAALAAPSSGLPGRLKGETQLLAGYCAAVAGDAQAAGLAAELAREEGIEAELPLAVLAGFADGTKPKLALPARVLLLDYRFLELLGPVNAAQIFDKAEPALLAVLAADPKAEARLQIAAAEAALRLNALSPEAVAEVYRRQSLAGAGVADPAAQSADPHLRHALYFQAIEAARAPAQRLRFLRAILDDARRSGSHLQMARVMAPLVANLPPSPDAAWFAETSLEIALLAGQFDLARRWAESASLRHWLALIDVADPERRGGRPPSLAADGGAGRARPARRRDAAPAGHRARRARHRRADRPVGRGEPHAATRDRLPARDRRAGGPRAVGQAQRRGPHHPARHAHAGTRRSRGRQPAGAGRRRARPEAHRAGGRRPAAGARGAARGVAAHGRQLRGPQTHDDRMTIAAGQRQHLEAFLEMLAAERGAAANTLQAYRRDLEDFLVFLERRDKPLAGAAPAEIGAYHARAVRVGAGAGIARAPAVRHPPAVQVPGRRKG